eukprot:614324-Amphidinium_carterae.1
MLAASLVRSFCSSSSRLIAVLFEQVVPQRFEEVQTIIELMYELPDSDALFAKGFSIEQATPQGGLKIRRGEDWRRSSTTVVDTTPRYRPTSVLFTIALQS